MVIYRTVMMSNMNTVSRILQNSLERIRYPETTQEKVAGKGDVQGWRQMCRCCPRE